MIRCFRPAVLASIVLSGLVSCAMDEGLPADVGRPRNSDALTASIPDNSMYLFDNADYKGTATRLDTITAMPAGAIQPIGRSHRVTSAQWNLPAGVVVILYENSDGKGDQIALWGQGQVPSVSLWKANDKLNYWGWYGISGRGSTGELEVGYSPRPPTAMPTSAVAAGTIEMYDDRDFKGTLTTFGPVGATPVGALQRAGAATDKMTSLRWNLPPGMLVVLYGESGGKGRQLAIWGSGQYSTVTPMNFNDKVSGWAWYDVAGFPQRRAYP